MLINCEKRHHKLYWKIYANLTKSIHKTNKPTIYLKDESNGPLNSRTLQTSYVPNNVHFFTKLQKIIDTFVLRSMINILVAIVFIIYQINLIKIVWKVSLEFFCFEHCKEGCHYAFENTLESILTFPLNFTNFPSRSDSLSFIHGKKDVSTNVLHFPSTTTRVWSEMVAEIQNVENVFLNTQSVIKIEDVSWFLFKN